MRQSDFKYKYDPELGRFTRQHIYGEGVMDVFKNIGAKVIGQTLKKAAKTAATKAVTTAATKTGEHVQSWPKVLGHFRKNTANSRIPPPPPMQC